MKLVGTEQTEEWNLRYWNYLLIHSYYRYFVRVNMCVFSYTLVNMIIPMYSVIVTDL